MKYLYIKMLILLAILILPTLIIESEAAGSSPILLNTYCDDGECQTVYFPKTGNLCTVTTSQYGNSDLEKIVIPKNLTKASYKKLKGTYYGRSLAKMANRYGNGKGNYNWRIREENKVFNGNNDTFNQNGESNLYKAFLKYYNECNNNKLAVLLIKYKKEKREFYKYN